MNLFKLLVVLCVLTAALWIAQPWIQHYLGLAKPKALVEVVYSAFDITPADDYADCNVTARIVIRNAGGGDAQDIFLALVLTDSAGGWRLNKSIEADSLAGDKTLKNVTDTVTTECTGFYENNQLVGNASVTVASFQTAA